MTRSRLTQVWFATISLIVVAALALGVMVTIGTGRYAASIELSPVGDRARALASGPTDDDVLYGRDRRA